MNQQEDRLKFVVYCIEILKDLFHTSGNSIWILLNKYGIDEILYNEYDELHSHGKVYIIEYIAKELRARGENI
ncbi:MAG: DUF3791 domain-containing protein [Firmicutes bacterium]|nr:DUF3791 domain-containing protein [Bacillota bacterium]